jgi:hypothetical protein
MTAKTVSVGSVMCVLSDSAAGRVISAPGGRFVRRAEVLDRALDRRPVSPLHVDEPLAAK